MINFYQLVRENLNFNRFQFRDTVCLEYTCPIDAEQVGIFSSSDYLVYVLSGRKTYKTARGEWTLQQGQALYLKKGAEIIHQYFDDEYCMLGFFLSDDLIRETAREVKGSLALNPEQHPGDFTAREVAATSYLDGYFHSMLNYFRGIDRPPDAILMLKLKELLITLMNADSMLAAYFMELSAGDRPSLREIMENNFCYNLELEAYAELTHRSLSSFKRDFRQQYGEPPGKWLLRRREQHAAHLLSNTRMNITQVAFESGFEDLSHFSRAFKSIMDMNPSDYRKG